MMTNPGGFLEAFAKAGADGCSVHVEVGDTADLVKSMHDLGLDAGLAVNPDTPFEAFEQYLGDLELVLLMTVFPGFGGQAFIADVLPKVRETRDAIAARGLRLPIQVDGGIDAATAPAAAEAGASVFVAGSAIFGADDPLASARAIRVAAERANG
jgi:ribulose-phosphate 3-epimerase